MDVWFLLFDLRSEINFVSRWLYTISMFLYSYPGSFPRFPNENTEW